MKYFYRLILIGIISACIPIILAGVAYDRYSVNNVIKQEQFDAGTNISLVQERMERAMQGIEVNALHLAMNPLLSEAFSVPQFDGRLLLHLQILKAIEEEKSNNDLIGDLYFFHQASGVVLSDTYGYIHADAFKYGQDIKEAMKLKTNSAWMNLPAAAKDGYLSYVRKLPILGEGETEGLLVVEVKSSLIRSDLEDTGNLKNQHAVYVLGNRNQLLLGTSAVRMAGFADSAFQSLKSHPGSKGQFFAANAHHQEFLYTFSRSTEGRTYVSVISKSLLYRKAGWIRWATLFCCLFLLSIGVLLAYVNAHRAYHPIEQLLRFGLIARGSLRKLPQGNEISFIKECLEQLDGKVRSLSEYVMNVKPKLQEQFLQGLLEGSYQTADSIQQECLSHQIEMSRQYIVLAAGVGSFTRSRRFRPNDETLITFVLKNVMNEVLRKNFGMQGYITHLTPAVGIAILYFDPKEPSEDVLAAVRKYAGSICSVMEKYLFLNVSVGVGKLYDRIFDVTASYREAMLALQSRIYSEAEPVLMMEEMHNQKEMQLQAYPRHIESALLSALQRRDRTGAGQALREFSEAVQALGSSQSIYLCYNVLLSTIVLSLEKSGVNIFEVLETDLFKELTKCRTTEEICDWFEDNVFEVYLAESESQSAMRSKKAVRSVCQYIQEHITEDLSLMQCAEIVQMNPSSLSRLFKKEMGTSFVEFVVKCKVEEAKRLCLDTNFTMNEIADTVGYSERNLNRVFRRYVQMTPGQYRADHR